MPATNLETPKTITNVVTTIKVTGLVNDTEREIVEIHFITLLADGTPYQRGVAPINGYDAVKALYAEMDAAIATGQTFENASRAVLYNHVLTFIG